MSGWQGFGALLEDPNFQQLLMNVGGGISSGMPVGQALASGGLSYSQNKQASASQAAMLQALIQAMNEANDGKGVPGAVQTIKFPDENGGNVEIRNTMAKENKTGSYESTLPMEAQAKVTAQENLQPPETTTKSFISQALSNALPTWPLANY